MFDIQLIPEFNVAVTDMLIGSKMWNLCVSFAL